MIMLWNKSPLFNHDIVIVDVKKMLAPYGDKSPLYEERVQYYLELMKNNVKIPLIVLQYDSDEIKDGFHRYNAYLRMMKINNNLHSKIPVYRWKRVMHLPRV